jgi:TP901 family phage tail tape measure protein
MADDIRSDIIINVDTSVGIAEIKNLQRQISQLNAQLLQSGTQQAKAAQNIQRNLINNINATGKFAANVRTISTTAESFTTALERNKLGFGETFRYAGAATKTFGRFFKSEFATIEKVARERVKTLQTQFIKLGRDGSGAMKAISVRPLALDMDNLATKTAIAAQKQQLFNQLLQQGSTNLLNFGKNTQWAGRQLMVGFSIPLAYLGTIAAKTFMQMEEQAIKFKRVYGDTFTASEETDKMIKQVQELASEFTKYGVQVEKTMAMAADAAAMGLMNADLLAQVNQATRLSVLGGVEQEQALETTISLMNAFGTSAKDLAGEIDFLNAVENQTIVAIEDMTIAIPKAAPVVKQLGGDMEDLAFFMTAMKEGGINASEGANALKSGLASLINPAGKANEFLLQMGINLKGIVDANKGDVRGLVVDFASALDTLDPLNRARAIEQLFGKFQFARLSTLFQNVIKEGTQAQRVAQISQQTAEELAILSEREMKRVEDSPMYKFKKAVEDLKVSLVPLGEAFLKAITPVIEFAKGLLDRFNNMSDGAKNFVVVLTTVFAGIGPVLLMTFGLIANGVANLIKMFTFISKVFRGTGASSKDLATSTEYMTQQQLEASAVAASLDQSHAKLIQTFNVEAASVDKLATAYSRAVTAQARLLNVPIGPRNPAGQKPMKLRSGIVSVPGPKGAGDIVPAMLSPGEAVIPAKQSEKYAGLIQGMVNDDIPGYRFGRLGAAASSIGSKAKSLLGQVPISRDKKNSKEWNQLTPPTSGWGLMESVVRTLTGRRGSYGKSSTFYENKFADRFLRRSKKDVAVRMFADDLVSSLGRGDTRYANIFQTGGKSRGSLDEAGGQREIAENKLFGFDSKTDPSKRPAYGYLFNRDVDLAGGPRPLAERITGKRDPNDRKADGQFTIRQATRLMNENTYRYGDIAMVLKKRALRGRTTITQGDSLNAMLQKYATPAKFGTRNRDALEAAKTSGKGQRDFFEAQILGGFSFRDIKRIVSTEPEKIVMLQRALREAGIKGIKVGMPQLTMMQKLKKFVYGKKVSMPKMPRTQPEGSGQYTGSYRNDPLVLGNRTFWSKGGVVGQSDVVKTLANRSGNMFEIGTVSVPKIENIPEQTYEIDVKDKAELTKIQAEVDRLIKGDSTRGITALQGRNIVDSVLENYGAKGANQRLSLSKFREFAIPMAELMPDPVSPTKLGQFFGETAKTQERFRGAPESSPKFKEMLADPKLDPSLRASMETLMDVNERLYYSVIDDPETLKEYETAARKAKKENAPIPNKADFLAKKALAVTGFDPGDRSKGGGLERGHGGSNYQFVKRSPLGWELGPATSPDFRVGNNFISALTKNNEVDASGKPITTNVYDQVKELTDKYPEIDIDGKKMSTQSLLAKMVSNASLSAAEVKLLGKLAELGVLEGVDKKIGGGSGRSFRIMARALTDTKIVKPDGKEVKKANLDTLDDSAKKVLNRDELAKRVLEADKLKPKLPKGFTLRGKTIFGFNKGVVSVPGQKGKGDVVPAMLSPGEAVIPTKMADKYAPLINSMISDSVPGYNQGKGKKVKKKGPRFGGDYGPIQRGEVPATPPSPDPKLITPAVQQALTKATSTMGNQLAESVKKNFNPRNMRGSIAAIRKDIVGSVRQLVKQSIGGASQAVMKTLRDPSAVKVLQGQALLRGGQFGPMIAGGIQAASSAVRFADKHPVVAETVKNAGQKAMVAANNRFEALTEKIGAKAKAGWTMVNPATGKPVNKVDGPDDETEEEKRQRKLQEREDKKAARGTLKERYNRANESYKAKMGGITQGAGMAAGGAMMGAMMLGMGEGPMAQMANDLMPALLVASIALPLMGSLAGAIAVAVAAVVGSIMLLNAKFDDAQKKVLEYSETMKASRQAMQTIAEFGGNVTASEAMDRRRAERDRELGAVSGKTTYGEAFVQTEAGKKQTEILAKQIASGNREGSVKDMTSQLTSAVLSGAMNFSQARSMAANLSTEAGDASIAIDVIANMEQLLGPDGTDVLKDPLGVRLNALQANQDAMQQSMATANAGVQKNMFGGVSGSSGDRIGTTLGLAAGGAVAGAIIGSAVPLIGTAIGAVVGGIGGAVAGYFLGEQNAENYGKLGAAAAVDAKIALEQNKELLDSMDMFYEKKIKELRIQGKINEANAMQTKYMDERKILTDQMAAMNQEILNSFNESPELQESLTSGAIKATDARYKDDPDQLAYVDVVRAQADQLKLGEDQQYLIELKMSSGEIPPATMRKLMDMASGDAESQTAVLNIITKFSGDVAGRTAELGAMLGDKDLARRLTLEVDAQESDGDAQDLLNNISELTKIGQIIPAKVAVDFYLANSDAYDKFNKLMDTINDKKPKTIKALLEIAPELKGKISKEDEAYFNTLTDDQKVLYSKTLVSQLYVPEAEIIASEDYTKWLGEDVTIDGYRYGGAQYAGMSDSVKVGYYRAHEAFKATQADAAAAPKPPGGGGGGGGGGRNEPLDDPLTRLKEIRDSRINAKGGKKELMRLLGGKKDITKFTGMEQLLLQQGGSSEFVDYLMGLDEAQQKKFFKTNKKTGAITLTDQGKATSKAFDEIALGEFQLGMKRATIDVSNQNVALQRLVASGMSVSEAYAAVEDTAFAAAVATKELSNEELKKITEEAKRAEKALKQFAAARALREDVENENRDLRVTERFAQGATKFDFAQQQAILEDSNLREIYGQYLAGEISTLPPEFKTRLEQVVNSLEFKEGLFTDGLNKAMDKFAAEERAIDIKAELSIVGDRRIAEVAQNDIAALQYQIDDYQAGLQEIAWQEEEISKSYEKKYEALDRIEEVNQRITAQQQKQLGLADALSRGDIAAAARAAQEMRDQSARDAVSSQRDALERAQKLQTDALLSKSGMTRQQLDDKILANQKKIFEIEETRLEPAQENIRKAEAAASLAKQDLKVAGKTKLEWDQISNGIELARTNSEEYTKAINGGLAVVKDIENYYNTKPSDRQSNVQTLFSDAQNAATNAKFNQKPGPAATGGPSSGGGSGSGDGDPSGDETGAVTESLKADQFNAVNTTTLQGILNASKPGPNYPASGADAARNSQEDVLKRLAGSSKTQPIIAPGLISSSDQRKPQSFTVPLNKWFKVPKNSTVYSVTSKDGIYTIQYGKKGGEYTDSQGKTRGWSSTTPSGALGNSILANGRIMQTQTPKDANKDYPRKFPSDTIGFNSGGFVANKFAVRNADTVPAMLTPGEFVMRKYAVENFGADRLKAINNGTYKGDSMYNYEVNVNVQTDSNPDQIARAVMNQIKHIDSQRIRGNKF